MNKVASYLNQYISGNVFDKDAILEAYSTDRSILKIKPRFVALPENTQDLSKILTFINQLAIKNYKIPIAVRGSGLDKTGADLTNGMVISMEKMNHIKEIDPRSRLVRVEAGVTLGQLNSALSLHGLTIAINAHPGHTIGGIIANCQVDSFASKYGGVIKHIERIEAVLSNGDRLQTTKMSHKKMEQLKDGKSFENRIYKNIDELLSNQKQTINNLANSSYDSSGYPAVTCVKTDKSFDLAPIFLASQGTLGIISEIILRCDVSPSPSRHLLVTFNSIQKALEFLNFALPLNPAEANIYDMRIFEKSEEYGKKLKFITKKTGDDSFLVVLNFNESNKKNSKHFSKCLEHLPRRSNYFVEDKENQIYLKELIGALNNYLNSDARGERFGFLDDFYIPSLELGAFIEDLVKIEKKFKIDLPIYGSFATENYYVRPDIKLEMLEPKKDENDKTIEPPIISLIRVFHEAILIHKGSFTGGAPEGRSKAFVTTPAMSEERKNLYEKIKEIFDPNSILNPDIKLGIEQKQIIKNLRTSYDDHIVI